MRVAQAALRAAVRLFACAVHKRAVAHRRRRRWLGRSAASAFLGREFMPKLEEGNFWIRATLAHLHLARTVGPLRRAHARPSCAVARTTRAAPAASDSSRPEITDRHLPARAPGRRHGRLGLLQHRALAPLRADQANGARGVTKEGDDPGHVRRSWPQAFPASSSTSRRSFPTTSRRPCRASRARTRSRWSAPICT